MFLSAAPVDDTDRSVDSAPSTRSTGVDELSSPFTVPGFGAAATCHPTMHQLK